MATNPDNAFMAQVARNITDHVDGFLRGMRSELIQTPEPQPDTGDVAVSERLGGLLEHDHRVAA